MISTVQIINGDALTELRKLPDESVHACVTSPPYWHQRDYGIAGQIGLEKTPDEFVATLVNVFEEVRRVLRADGTCWINISDTFSSGGKGGGGSFMLERSESSWKKRSVLNGWRGPAIGLKRKELCLIPFRLGLALQKAGWYFRCDIIWRKTNPAPESAADRPTREHEYLFLLSRSEHYVYDAEAIKEKCSPDTHARMQRAHGRHVPPGQPEHTGVCGTRKRAPNGSGIKNNGSFDAAMAVMPEYRNKRSVWTTCTGSFGEDHFATFPPDLIKPCILAGCPVGGTVLDPFAGSFTTCATALELGRNSIGIELNPDYCAMGRRRCHVTPGMAF